jgi:tyrosyl-tRNA synthetase
MLGSMSATEFLRDYGKLFSVNQMLQRDSVRTRLKEREQGMSFTEFSYGILQAIDFHHLHGTSGVTVQIGGSDQWGNIIGGIDLVRRLSGQEVFGVTAPLVKQADGQKFGKTEQGSVWLTKDRTSPFAYYQFWMNTSDADVEGYLKLFTFVEVDEIIDVSHRHAADPGRRCAQRRLAWEATSELHGKDAARQAREASEAMFSGDLGQLTVAQLEAAFGAVESSEHRLADLASSTLTLEDVLVGTGICSSKREAREMLQAGAIRMNSCIAGVGELMSVDRLAFGSYALIVRGKRVRHLARWR